MGIFELFLIAVGLSMDAFAAATCKGLSMRGPGARNAALVGLFFGGFQAAMPILGWLLGRQFESYITVIDHWVAFLLLAYIGGKMIFEVLRPGRYPEPAKTAPDLRELLLLAVATSIDALAVGITFAFLQVKILPAAALIGAITFVFSFAGFHIGRRFGTRFKSGAGLLGGSVLILIGLKILLEHLGTLG